MEIKSLLVTLGNETVEFIVGRMFAGRYKITKIEEVDFGRRGWLIKTEIDGKEVMVAIVFSDAGVVIYDVSKKEDKGGKYER